MTSGSSSRTSAARWAAGLVLLAALGAAGWAGFTPIATPSREEVFVIPDGTWARRMAGAKTDILPSEIRLTLGVRDVLVLENRDSVPQIFGPTLMMPGQSFRLPFQVASRYPFECSAHVSGQMTVVVEPEPSTPWARLWWRTREIVRPVGAKAAESKG
jgi:hypothetical protein